MEMALLQGMASLQDWGGRDWSGAELPHPGLGTAWAQRNSATGPMKLPLYVLEELAMSGKATSPACGHIFTPSEDWQRCWAVEGRIPSGTEISKACESPRLPMFSQSTEAHRIHFKCTQKQDKDPLRSALGSLAWEQESSLGLCKVPLESGRGITETDVRIHRIPQKQPQFRD